MNQQKKYIIGIGTTTLKYLEFVYKKDFDAEFILIDVDQTRKESILFKRKIFSFPIYSFNEYIDGKLLEVNISKKNIQIFNPPVTYFLILDSCDIEAASITYEIIKYLNKMQKKYVVICTVPCNYEPSFIKKRSKYFLSLIQNNCHIISIENITDMYKEKSPKFVLTLNNSIYEILKLYK